MAIMSGQLRDRMIFEKPVPVQGDYGNETTAWTSVATKWVRLISRGRSLFQAQQVNALLTHEVQMRYTDQIKPNYRGRIGDRVFSIQSIADPDNRRRELMLTCIEDVD